MMTENIIDRYETVFGKAIVLSSEHLYRVGDQILTQDGIYRIKRIILPTRPSETNLCSFIVE